jgi:hypothetical protein
MPGMKTMMSAANSPPSVLTLPGSNPTILCPRWVAISRRFISPIRRSTAFSPRRLPGLGMGLKKTSLIFSRRPSRRNWVSSPNRNSKIGPPRIAVGSFGLPAKPSAMVPDSSSATRVRRRSTGAMPSQGRMASSMPGSFLMKRPPQAMMRPSLATGPVLVSTLRPPSASPLASAATNWMSFSRRNLSSGTTRSCALRLPEGSQIRLGR